MENAVKHDVIILARMGEIALKGLNRGKFEHQLISNLTYRLRQLGNFYIFQSQSRLWIEPKAALPLPISSPLRCCRPSGFGLTSQHAKARSGNQVRLKIEDVVNRAVAGEKPLG